MKNEKDTIHPSGSWNYRIVERQHPCKWYAIYEVYYHIDGSPAIITEDPIEPTGESKEELKTNIDMMLQAFNKPTLKYEDFSIDE